MSVGFWGWVGFIVDWIPLSVGSVRPTQGRTVGLAQVSRGSAYPHVALETAEDCSIERDVVVAFARGW